MVSSTLCPAVHILGSQNVYCRAEGMFLPLLALGRLLDNITTPSIVAKQQQRTHQQRRMADEFTEKLLPSCIRWAAMKNFFLFPTSKNIS